MTAGGPEIWLADLIRARARVGAGRESDLLIAQLLLGEGSRGQRPENLNALSDLLFGDEIDDDELTDDDGAEADESAESEGELDDLAATFPELEPIRTESVPATNWQLVSSFPAATQSQLDLRPPLIPLLPPNTTPAILQTVLRAKAFDGEPDTARMVEKIARGMPLTRIIRRPRPTMRYGTQILLDVGEAMEPFARDQRELVARISALVGAEGVEVVSFADAPLRGVRRGRARTREPYAPPPPGTRVLIVSDLGVGGRTLNPLRADPEEWLGFIDEIEHAECSAVALVPFSRRRIPASLAARLPLVTWDRGTDAIRAAVAAIR